MTIETPKTDPLAKARAVKAAKREAEKAAQAQTPAPVTTDAAIRAKRAALMAELAELPLTEAEKQLRPGTKVGTGPTQDLVPFTPSWFTDVEARRQDRDERGTLIWPQYSLHEVMASKTEYISVNGVTFVIYGGHRCKLPEPHYNAYMDSIERGRQNERDFAPPQNPARSPGYVSPVHIMGIGPIPPHPDQAKSE